jgi:hypothetical protein
MNIDSAFETHAQWIESFCEVIFKQDTIDVNAYEKDENCELGKWLYGAGKVQYGQSAAFANLIACHAEFHRLAANVAKTINAKEFDRATQLLQKEGEYAEASRAVYQAILKLRNEIKLT